MGELIQVDFLREDVVETQPEAQEPMPRYIEFPEKFEVGQRIHCTLYNGKDGTIIAIHGEQNPGSIRRLSGIMSMGGNASLDVAWDTYGDRGGFSRQTPESIARGPQWRMLSGHRNPVEAIAEAELYEAKKEAQAKKEAEEYEQAKVKVEKDYPYLTKDDGKDRNILQKNLRKMLKKKFPDTKFSVTKSHYSSINVSWTDGPNSSDVKKLVTNWFCYGYYDVYEDYHGTKSTPFTDVFGGCQYLSDNREYSDEFVSKAIDAVWEKYHSMFKGSEKPTVEMYRNGSIRNLTVDGWNRNFSEFIWEYMSEH